MTDAIQHIGQTVPKRDRRDAGRANAAWRWFSERTIHRAARYRDLTWRHVARHMVVAVTIMLVSRLVATEPYGPFLLIIGAIWTFLMVRIVFIKTFDTLTRRRESQG